MGILLKQATIVTQNKNREIISGDLLIEDDRITKIDSRIPPDHHEVYQLNNRIVIPGLIQAHVHLCQTLFRNLADDLELLDWLQDRIWPFEMAHDEYSLQASAKLGLAELLLGGTTCILDMGNLKHQDSIFRMISESGIRAFSGKVLMDQGEQSYKEDIQEALSASESLIRQWHLKDNSRIHYALAPRFVPSCSPDLWKGVRELSKKYDVIIHTHSSENKKEWELVKQLTGDGNVEFFINNGMGSPKLCLAHCIWVSPKEIELMAEAGINILHCPSANLKLGSGIAPVPEFIKKGINVALGADGAPCNNNLDMFNEMRLAALIQKPRHGVTSTSAQMVFDMATLGGARALGLEQEIGSLEPGKKADLAVLDLNKVHSIPADNIYSQIVYSAYASDVQDVMVNGEWLVKKQKLTKFKYSDIIEESWEQIQKIFERIR